MVDYYEVIEAFIWKAGDGASASIYGAVPWRTEDERVQRGWRKVNVGWTVRNPLTGQVGTGKPPQKTFQEACEYALKLGRPSAICIGD